MEKKSSNKCSYTRNIGNWNKKQFFFLYLIQIYFLDFCLLILSFSLVTRNYLFIEAMIKGKNMYNQVSSTTHFKMKNYIRIPVINYHLWRL